MTVTEHLTMPASKAVTTTDTDVPGEVSGYAAVYDNVDLQGDLLTPGAVTKSLAYWERQPNKPPLLDWHGSSLGALIGSVVELRSTPVGLWFRATFSNDPQAQAVRRKVVEGHLSGVSIGYLPIRQSFKQLADRTVRVLHEIRLMEISLTPLPANPEAQVQDVKSYGGYSPSAGDDDTVAVEEALKLAELERWEERQRPVMDAAGHQLVADVLGRVEAETQLAKLTDWAASPEVKAAMRRDPGADVAERDRRRWQQANDYSSNLSEWMRRNR